MKPVRCVLILAVIKLSPFSNAPSILLLLPDALFISFPRIAIGTALPRGATAAAAAAFVLAAAAAAAAFPRGVTVAAAALRKMR